jgi:hypothetical protein
VSNHYEINSPQRRKERKVIQGSSEQVIHTKAGIQYLTDSELTGFQLLLEYQTYSVHFLKRFVGKLLCVLCIFAVKTVFMVESNIVEYGCTGCLEKSVSRVVFTGVMFVFSANFASLR